MRGRREWRPKGGLTLCSCLWLSFLCCFLAFACRGCSDLCSSGCGSGRTPSQREELISAEAEVAEEGKRLRRKLMEPGSHPPRCVDKCDGCAPCRPLRVRVPPAAAAEIEEAAEYYPEVWRCQCGGRYFMP
ncbi:EPIDERMAL PATTERNING FACTOR-like protein 5 [Zingiber officinale]|uniref:EPIDERMAL PATTERNING FACTOR-like protein 5 n=1 Tax=Zingiber officinale TaxID=94328 RepID=UPI001C4C67FC|nr:EPIDERMAL PATTERNING FACTOR-like protein 5 [Zingiber officinale]